MTRLLAFAPLAVFLGLVGCGGGGLDSSGGTTPVPPSGSNVAPITVDAGPAAAQGDINMPSVTVTICAPGSTSNCQTIDHVELDTGSYGLRILSSVLNASLALPQENTDTGGAVLECTQFADGFSWGPVKTADIQITGEAAASVPVQIIGDPAFPGVPNTCSSSGPSEDTVATFGANGILGVGPFIQDAGLYYTCTSGICSELTALDLNLQVSNPVAFFAADNNGVIVELPAVGTGGSGVITGSLVFGIGTQSNNALGTATVYTVDANSGVFTITYKNQAFDFSFLDTGSTANYFDDSSIPTCSSNAFYCPASTLSLTASVTGVNSTSNSVAFSVANAENLFTGDPSAVAFSNLGASNSMSGSFDFGLPFFFGRSVFVAIAEQTTPGGNGPYFAF
jgi:hypothetical protein